MASAPLTSVSANQSPHATGGTQYRTDTNATIAEGGTIPQGGGVRFGATVTDPDAGDTVQIQVELHQLPAAFTGTANYSSGFVASGQQAMTAAVTGLAPGNYGWAYRAVDNHGLATNWVSAGNPDFIVQAVANPVLSVNPAAASVPATAGSTSFTVSNTGSER
jgi:hypothetical protein